MPENHDIATANRKGLLPKLSGSATDVLLGNGTFGTAPGAITIKTEQASTSGTSIDFTGIPSGTKRITIMVVGVSTNGTSDLLIQLGDAGGIETTGYLGASSSISSGVGTTSYTAGFGIINGSGATGVLHGTLHLNLEDSTDFTWVADGVFANSDVARTYVSAGRKATSAELTQVRITTVNGTDTFDAGVINVSYEA